MQIDDASVHIRFVTTFDFKIRDIDFIASEITCISCTYFAFVFIFDEAVVMRWIPKKQQILFVNSRAQMVISLLIFSFFVLF